MDLSRIEDATLRKKPEIVKLDPSYEVFMLREDLVRATHAETVTTTANGRTVTSTRQVPNEYSELVIDFGNGIIMDYNENLCIDLMKLYGIDSSHGFMIERSGKGFMNGKRYFEFAGKQYKTNYESKRNVVFSGNEIRIESGLLKSIRTLVIDDDKIQLNGKFLGMDIKKEARKVDDGTIAVSGFWKDDTFKMKQPGLVSLGKYFDIRKEADYINITYSGIFGYTKSLKCYITHGGIIFIDKDNRGMELIKDGKSIQVMRNNKKVAEYFIR